MHSQSNQQETNIQIIGDYPYSIPEAGSRIGFKTTTIYSLIKKGELAAIKLGSQTRIMGHELRRYLESAPAYKTEA